MGLINYVKMMAGNPVTLMVLVAASIFVALAVYAFVGGFVAFLWNQVLNLHALYTRWTKLDVSTLHPYTQSLIANTAPELARLRALHDQLAHTTSPELRAQGKAIVSNILRTLDKEHNRHVRLELQAQFSARMRDFA